ncbi:hypothetical protein D9M68_139420 [compost metagenome]
MLVRRVPVRPTWQAALPAAALLARAASAQGSALRPVGPVGPVRKPQQAAAPPPGWPGSTWPLQLDSPNRTGPVRLASNPAPARIWRTCFPGIVPSRRHRAGCATPRCPSPGSCPCAASSAARRKCARSALTAWTNRRSDAAGAHADRPRPSQGCISPRSHPGCCSVRGIRVQLICRRCQRPTRRLRQKGLLLCPWKQS